METIVHMTTFCLFLFRSYRTYEEWKPTFLMFTPPSLLCSYRTYEEWKRGHGHFISSVKDSSYRTYEEWKLWNHKRSTQWRLVLTVPMRNGNNDIHRVNSPWVLQVLTVPMRNGNSVPSLQFRWVCSSFLPYLWGMETTDGNYFLVTERTVLTVPMRNGNVLGVSPRSTVASVLTVPMRNGNILLWLCHRGLCLVLTVPMRNGNFSISFASFSSSSWFLPYLWGMETTRGVHNLEVSMSSYRTYEEWKPSSTKTIPLRNFRFLPYLWGMETAEYRVNNLNQTSVLTVPMRNGNCRIPCEQSQSN